MTRRTTRSARRFLRTAGPAAILLLAGCGGFDPAAPSQPPSPEQVACERRANDAPAVREIMNKIEGNMHYQREHEDELRAAKQDATLACLRAQGIVRPGGVERQKPLR